jgi:hypothetical protein
MDHTVTAPALGHFGLISWDDKDDNVPPDSPAPDIDVNLDWIMTGARGIKDSNTSWSTEGKDGSGWVESVAKRRLGNNKGLLLSVRHPTVMYTYSAQVRFLLKE